MAIAGLVLSGLAIVVSIAFAAGVVTVMNNDSAVERIEQEVNKVRDQLPPVSRSRNPDTRHGCRSAPVDRRERGSRSGTSCVGFSSSCEAPRRRSVVGRARCGRSVEGVFLHPIRCVGLYAGGVNAL
nr:hypothetical protein JVH1_8772 [Rhodococcus sp. JVH1]